MYRSAAAIAGAGGALVPQRAEGAPAAIRSPSRYRSLAHHPRSPRCASGCSVSSNGESRGLIDAGATAAVSVGRYPHFGSRHPIGHADLFLGLFLIVTLGVIDDLVGLWAPLKLVAQVACVAAMVLRNDLLIENAGVLYTGHALLLVEWAAPVTIFAVVGMVNT